MGCAWIRLTFDLVDWVNQIVCIVVGLPQSVKGLSRTKRLTLPWVRENSYHHQLFLAPEPPSIGTGITGFSGSQSFDLPRNYSIGCPGSRAQTWLSARLSYSMGCPCSVQTLELSILYNHVSQFFIVNLCMSYVCISYWFCSSREHWLIQGTSLPLGLSLPALWIPGSPYTLSSMPSTQGVCWALCAFTTLPASPLETLSCQGDEQL